MSFSAVLTPLSSFLTSPVSSSLPRRQINGETKQSDSTELMLYRIPQLIEHVSSIMRLEEGDLILTGTSSHRFLVHSSRRENFTFPY